MFEVVRDWNYAPALIALKALSIRTSGTAGAIECTLKALSASRAEKYFPESAFSVAVALTRQQDGAQTRITSSELRDRQRAEHNVHTRRATRAEGMQGATAPTHDSFFPEQPEATAAVRGWVQRRHA